MRLKKIEPMVKKILEKVENARKNDFILYGLVLLNMGYDLNQSIGTFLAKAKANKVPSFGGVTRCRRHIQELMPELKDFTVDVYRNLKTEEYKEYNLSGLEE